MIMNKNLEKLKSTLQKRALVTDKDRKIVGNNSSSQNWLFDIKSIFLDPETLDVCASIFWEKFEDQYPFQVGGRELASVPFITAIVLKGKELGKPANGFVIRKARKKDGLQNIIEGQLNNHKIILVDDLINSGSSFAAQTNILENAGLSIFALFSVVQFRDSQSYEFFTKKDIKIHSIFNIKDFSLNLNEQELSVYKQTFKIIWKFIGKNPNYYYSIPKSNPIIDDKNIYFGTDFGEFLSLSQETGKKNWSFAVGPGILGKRIFSSPTISNNLVYFGSYDGNVYALDKNTGKEKWTYKEADWVGSSPTSAENLNMLFIGLEFSLPGKQGGIVALDLATGEKKWQHTIPEYVHSTPGFSKKCSTVVIGSNAARVYAFNAKNGKLLWSFSTGTADVKAAIIISDKHDIAIFGSFDGNLYVLSTKTGKLKFKFKTESAIYSNPLVYKDYVYFSSTDKHIYCVDLKTKKLKWKFQTGGRIFSSPKIIEGKIYCGSNDGRMYILHSETGALEDFFQTTERVVNSVSYNQKMLQLFLPTYANEIYCLRKK